MRRTPPIQRLLSRCVESETGCWLYQGALEPTGYVRIQGEVTGSRAWGHWIAWEEFIGPKPDGLVYDHLCEVKHCVNPWHSDVVPLAVNNARAARNATTINATKTHCINGHSLSGDNLQFESRGYGRRCRTCSLEAKRRYRQRLREGIPL